MTGLRAVIWCAVSTKAQANEELASLPFQEADQRALCTEQGWQIVAVLRVPGHSRHYIDIHELAADARAEGIDAFDRILDLWQRKAFDVLICRDGNRFARTQSLHAYFVEMTISIGARIYSLEDEWINKKNYRNWTMANGYKAASHIDALVKARDDGMIKRMERGLNGGLDIPDPYRIVRDERGKALRLEFRQEYRRMLDDAATLLLEGVGWKAFAVEMYKRFGHVNPKTGQPYHDNNFYRWFFSPILWGVTAKGYANKQGLWAFDENEPLPAGVTVNRNPNPPIPAVWEGEIADRIKAELHRRVATVQGRATARTQYAFTGLFECASCHRRMAVDHKRNHLYWRCSSHTYRHYRTGQVCDNKKLLRNDTASEQINDFLKRVLAQRDFDITLLTRQGADVEKQRQQAATLQSEIAATRREIDAMIVNQSKAPEAVQEQYASQIERASQHLIQLESAHRYALSRLDSPTVKRTRQIAYGQLTAMGLEAFWQCTPREINQLLHALMGSYRFIVQDGEIIEARIKWLEAQQLSKLAH